MTRKEKRTRHNQGDAGNRLNGGLRLIPIVEAVEKVSKQIPGRDAKKSDLIECATFKGCHVWEGSSNPRKPPLKRNDGLFYRLVGLKYRTSKACC